MGGNFGAGIGAGGIDDTIVVLGTAGAAGPPVGPPTSNPTTKVKIIVGNTANVVPVEFVSVFEAGVVLAKEDNTNWAGVVPVREAPTEVPRIKMMLTG